MLHEMLHEILTSRNTWAHRCGREPDLCLQTQPGIDGWRRPCVPRCVGRRVMPSGTGRVAVLLAVWKALLAGLCDDLMTTADGHRIG